MSLTQNIIHTESTSLSLREAEFAPGINAEETTVLWVLLKQWLPPDTKCHLCLLEDGFKTWDIELSVQAQASNPRTCRTEAGRLPEF